MVKEISKLNILELNSEFCYAGGARNLYAFCKYLNKDIFNVFAASYGTGGVGEKILRDNHIEYIVANGSAEKILEYIKEKKIDLIHIHRSGVFVPIEYEILKKAKDVKKDLVVIEKNVFGNYDGRVACFVDCSLFQSMMHLNERYLPQVNKAFDFNKMKVLYNMVDIPSFEKFKVSQEEVESFKEGLGIRKDDFVIGKIARPHIAKWSDLILNMMPYLIRLIPNVKFIIVGVPRSRIKIINRSKFRSHYIILNETTDERLIHKFYQSIDVLVHSSKIGECNGNTINEAMFWGKPVVVNSTPDRDNGQLEQVIHMQDGIIANFPQTFARAIFYLFKNDEERKKMGDNARRKILNKNAPKVIVSQLEKVFIENLKWFDFVKGKISVSSTDYFPSEKDINDYLIIYQQRLKWDFGRLTFIEKIVNLSGKPRKIYYKIKDFLEHRFGL